MAIRGRWKKLSGRHGKRLSYKGKYIAVYDGRIIPTTAIHRSFGGHWVEYIRLRANFGAFVCHERIRDNGYKYGIKLKHLKKLAKAAESLAGPIPEQLERLVDLRQQVKRCLCTERSLPGLPRPK